MKFYISNILLQNASFYYFSDGIEEEESGQIRNTHQGSKRRIQEYWERDHFGDLGVDGDIL